jgi:hypothetical protein
VYELRYDMERNAVRVVLADARGRVGPERRLNQCEHRSSHQRCLAGGMLAHLAEIIGQSAADTLHQTATTRFDPYPNPVDHADNGSTRPELN